MKPNILTFLATVLLILCFTGCAKKLKHIGESEADTFQVILNTNVDPGVAQSGKSDAEKQWKKLYKTCGKNFIFENPNYLGLSNTKGIGVIIDKEKGRVLQLTPPISSSDSSRFISMGAVVPMCSKEINRDFDVNLLFNAALQSVSVDSLRAGFNRATSKKISSGNWFQVDAATDAYYSYVKSKPELSDYKTSLEKPDAYVVTGAIYVSNFSAELEYGTEAALGLKLKVDSNYIAPINNGNGQMSIRYNGNKKITILCNSMFVPLVVLSKIN
jgi:hypothetical protein